MITNIDLKQGEGISLYGRNDFLQQRNGGQVSPARSQQGLPVTDSGDTFFLLNNSKSMRFA